MGGRLGKGKRLIVSAWGRASERGATEGARERPLRMSSVRFQSARSMYTFAQPLLALTGVNPTTVFGI